MAVNHDKAYKSIHSREECAATTRSGAKVEIQTNSHPLASVVENASLRTERVYDWRKGTSDNRAMDVLTNAQRQISRAKICPVTNGRRRNSKDKDSDTNGPYGYPSVPTIGGRY